MTSPRSCNRGSPILPIACKRVSGRTGRVWQREYLDRVVRDAKELSLISSAIPGYGLPDFDTKKKNRHGGRRSGKGSRCGGLAPSRAWRARLARIKRQAIPLGLISGLKRRGAAAALLLAAAALGL